MNHLLEISRRLKTIVQDIDTPPYRKALNEFIRDYQNVNIFIDPENLKSALLRDQVLAAYFIATYILKLDIENLPDLSDGQ